MIPDDSGLTILEPDDSGLEPVGEAPATRKGIPDVEVWERVLRKWEDKINKGDGDAIRARWESGRRLVKLKKGRQLPKKMLDLLAVHFHVHRSELTARIKFAGKFSTEDELAKVIGSYRTWFAIKQYALTDKPRPKKKKPNDLERVLAIVENIDSATLGEGDYELLGQIEAGIKRLKDGVVSLKKKKVVAWPNNLSNAVAVCEAM